MPPCAFAEENREGPSAACRHFRPVPPPLGSGLGSNRGGGRREWRGTSLWPKHRPVRLGRSGLPVGPLGDQAGSEGTISATVRPRFASTDAPLIEASRQLIPQKRQVAVQHAQADRGVVVNRIDLRD